MALYDGQFFADHDDGVRTSSDVIVPILLDALKPTSVVDVGCGNGGWLASFQAHGVSDILGIDGDYVDLATLKIPRELFRAHDLSTPLRLDRAFDLAISLEVAEHLPPSRSEGFVDDLTRLAPVVAFSAAIPFQGGTGHLNERWQDEWAALFEARGFRTVDPIRRRVWDDERVMPWYAQNLLVYVSNGIELTGDTLPLRLVHPRRYVAQLDRPSSAVMSPASLAHESGRTVRYLMRTVGRRQRD